MNVGRSKVLNIFDGGIQKARNGRPLGIIIFNITTSEGKPENIIGYCHPNYRDSIIKNLKRLVFQDLAAPQREDSSEEPVPTKAPDNESFLAPFNDAPKER